MVWKTEDLNPMALQIPMDVKKYVHHSRQDLDSTLSAHVIGIIGGGPKGMYLVEELFRQLRSEEQIPPIEIFWWNETSNFGSGPNYDPEQPDYLLINYCIGHVDAWDQNSSASSDQLNLMQWLEKFQVHSQTVRPTDYASRAVVGLYLQDTLLNILAQKPPQVKITLLDEEVQNVHRISNNRLKIESLHHSLEVDHLLMATGHCYQNAPLVKLDKDTLPSTYFSSAYPLDQLNGIPPKEKVGIIGWGLTFIDVALALTEGKGGRFDGHGNYQPSGNEPVLLPFSRNQIPIMPRGPIYGEQTYALQLLTEEWWTAFIEKSKNEPIDFSQEIVPKLEQEIQFAYYSTLLQQRDKKIVSAYIQDLPESERFSMNHLLFPKLPVKTSVQEAYIEYITFFIEEAEKGELKSPLMAAAAVWREASPYIAQVYAFGGFTGASQRDLDQELFGAFCRTSYGPPIANMKKILALIKANVIQMISTESLSIAHFPRENKFQLKATKQREMVDYIIDARIARPNLMQHNSRIYQQMYTHNLVQAFDNEGYLPGVISMQSTGKIKHPEDWSIYLYGSNTEGILFDNDSLSRKKNNLAPSIISTIIHQMKTKPFHFIP